jgi:hypothetical protein
MYRSHHSPHRHSPQRTTTTNNKQQQTTNNKISVIIQRMNVKPTVDGRVTMKAWLAANKQNNRTKDSLVVMMMEREKEMQIKKINNQNQREMKK